eukprot:3543417-Pleurochrysis_carterae.AAC.1
MRQIDAKEEEGRHVRRRKLVFSTRSGMLFVALASGRGGYIVLDDCGSALVTSARPLAAFANNFST